MASIWQWLPRQGGYSIYVSVPGKGDVEFLLEPYSRIQDDHLPRLRSGQIRLRFPSETFAKEVVDRCVQRLQKEADHINASRFRRRRVKLGLSSSAEEWIESPEADTDAGVIGSADVILTRRECAAVHGPESKRLDQHALYPEWIVLIEQFHLGFEHGQEVMKEFAGMLAPVIVDALTSPGRTTAAQHEQTLFDSS